MRQGGTNKEELAEPVRHAPPKPVHAQALRPTKRHACSDSPHNTSAVVVRLRSLHVTGAGRRNCGSATMLGQLEQRQGCRSCVGRPYNVL